MEGDGLNPAFSAVSWISMAFPDDRPRPETATSIALLDLEVKVTLPRPEERIEEILG